MNDNRVRLSVAAILLGVVVFVWIQSNKIFTVTVNRLETYQRLRNVLDVMERDLANTKRTVDTASAGLARHSVSVASASATHAGTPDAAAPPTAACATP